MFEKMVNVNDQDVPVGWSLMLVPTPDPGVKINVGSLRDMLSEMPVPLFGSAADALDAAPDLDAVMRLWREYKEIAETAVGELRLIEDTIRETVAQLETTVTLSGVRATYKAGYTYPRTSVDTQKLRGMAVLIPQLDAVITIKDVTVSPSVKIELVTSEG